MLSKGCDITTMIIPQTMHFSLSNYYWIYNVNKVWLAWQNLINRCISNYLGPPSKITQNDENKQIRISGLLKKYQI
jgi:hypothetical protein